MSATRTFATWFRPQYRPWQVAVGATQRSRPASGWSVFNAATAAGLALLLVMGTPALADEASAELLAGMEGVSGYQKSGVLFDRVVITYNGQPIIRKRLRLRDRGASLKGRLGDVDVRGECRTVNGLNLDLQCRLFDRSGGEVAYLHVPRH